MTDRVDPKENARVRKMMLIEECSSTKCRLPHEPHILRLAHSSDAPHDGTDHICLGMRDA
jgi:hypothetical protein